LEGLAVELQKAEEIKQLVGFTSGLHLAIHVGMEEFVAAILDVRGGGGEESDKSLVQGGYDVRVSICEEPILCKVQDLVRILIEVL
jgi:hypothetical protein